MIVQRSIHAQFRDKLLARTKALKIGYGLDAGIDVGPVINEASLKKVEQYVQIGQDEGAKLICGGKRATEVGSGWFFQPTIFDEVTPNMRIAQEEIFGPVTAIIPVNDAREAVEVANNSDFGLSTAIYTKDINLAFEAVRDMESGLTYVNAPTIGAEVHMPFGGTKNTGNGHGKRLKPVSIFSPNGKPFTSTTATSCNAPQIDSLGE